MNFKATFRLLLVVCGRRHYKGAEVMNIEDHQKILSECHARHEAEIESLRQQLASRDAEVADLTLRIKLAEGNVQRNQETTYIVMEECESLRQKLAACQ
jgi:hypothetical protein